MTTKPFDQFNKRLFQALLSPLGTVIPNLAVLGAERMIDVFFAPNANAEPSFDELGTLAQMVDRPALLEPYRSALSNDDVETCMIKLFSLRSELQREYPLVTINAMPHLWVLAAEVSDRLIEDFTDHQPSRLGEGFYALRRGLRTTIVAIAELPVTPATLWLRLMGKGRTQEDAIEELLLLRGSDPKRTNALNLLAAWRINISITNQIQSEEQQTLMALSQAYLEWERETLNQGREQGREQGLAQAQLQLAAERRLTITSLMRLRYGAVDTALAAIVPELMALDGAVYTELLMQRSRTELLQHFGQPG
jgi:hypothetical protein